MVERNSIFHDGPSAHFFEFATVGGDFNHLCPKDGIPCLPTHLATGEQNVGLDLDAVIKACCALGSIGVVCRSEEYVLVDHVADLGRKI